MKLMAIGLLAAAKMNDPRNWQQPHADGTSGLGMSQLLILAGAILGVGALIYLVVYLIRGDHSTSATDSSSAHAHGGGRRRRKRLREHRPRNPTLAEAGGLPPLRDDPPKPSA